MNSRTETQSIESDAELAAVVALLAEPTRIPDWAPAFADAVTLDDGSRWRATKDGQDFSVRVVVNREAGTVDYLREISPGREGGAFIRVVPRPGGGSVVIMTLPVAPSAERAALAATLRDELNALVNLVESS
ncbi:SRPBCC family protein [Lapillicoccus sp.]|uniref:SRPBCC family protein n=1 Tax=Lapillicoccus sp. TaxID=1909287 RepID=UPI003263A61F